MSIPTKTLLTEIRQSGWTKEVAAKYNTLSHKERIDLEEAMVLPLFGLL